MEDVLLQVMGEDDPEDPHLDPEVHAGLHELRKLRESFDFFSDLYAYAEHVDPIDEGDDHDVLDGEDDGYESDCELTAATTFELINPGQSWHLFLPDN